MRYEFRTADGRVCCQTDNPNYLCEACKLRLRPAGVPDPPSLKEAIKRGRSKNKPITVAQRPAETQAALDEHYAASTRPMADGRVL